MSRTLSHSVVLQAPAEDIWEACKHADKILCDLMPEYFAKTEFLQGHGEPGSIRVITMGPGVYEILSTVAISDELELWYGLLLNAIGTF